MDPTRMMTSTCDLVTVTQTPVEGDLIETTATQTGVACQITPLTTDETGGRTVTERQTWRAFFPGGTNLRGVDRVVYAGDSYELDGEAQEWPQLGSIAAFVEARLVRTA